MISVATTAFQICPSPIGDLLLTSDGDELTGLQMDTAGGFSPDPDWDEGGPVLSEAAAQLAAYFHGELKTFDLPLAFHGTPFQIRVWKELCHIPYGKTISYQELARRVGNPLASRAVGSANGKNCIAVIIPCHRVIAASGTLGGFGGGLDRKAWLLQHECGRHFTHSKPMTRSTTQHPFA